MTISTGEKLRSGVAALAAVFLTAWFGHLLAADAPLLVAAIGASSVLLFALPSGPLSQPWPVLGGYLVSALVGVTCARFVPDLALASALAVSLSILGMLWLRCVHPPGGAVALHAVIGGAAVDDQGRLKGLVGIGDFIERAGARGPSDLRRKLARFLLHNMARENKVAAMMSPPPVIARTDMHIAELIPHFGREMCGHIPVVDEAQRYVGMVSQSALIAALYRSRLAEGAPAPS